MEFNDVLSFHELFNTAVRCWRDAEVCDVEDVTNITSYSYITYLAPWERSVYIYCVSR